MKKTIYFTLTLLAYITLASSCNSNNEKKVYVKASLPNGWSANTACDGSAMGTCGTYTSHASSYSGSSTGNTALQMNNDLFSQTDEFLMDLNINKNLLVSVLTYTSYYIVPNPTFETETIYVPNTVLVEVFVNGSVYDSRTVTLDGNGGSQSFNVIIE